MKKILSILLLLINTFAYSQQIGTLLSPKAINGYTVNGKVLMTATSGTTTGVPTWTDNIPYSILNGTPTIPSTVGLLPNTTSLTINGTTKTFTSTPSFTVGTLSGSLTANYIPLSVSSTSFTNSNISYDGTTIDVGGAPSAVIALKLKALDNTDFNGYRVYSNNGLQYSNIGWGGINSSYYLKLQSGASQDIELTPSSGYTKLIGNINISGLTSSKLVYSDASNNLSSVTLGSGLSLSGSTLTASGSGSTTTITAGTNITVTGSAPNYTISTPTQTTGLIGLSSLSATSPLFYNNSTGVFTVQPASTSQNGVLSSTDWNTFNNKQNALTAGTNITISTNTISAASPTIVAGSNMSVTTSGLSYTVAATTQTTGLASTSSPTITSPTFSTSSTYSYATASTVPIFNGSKQLVSSSTTTTELTYLAGVTSSVQTQLDAKLSSTKERLLYVGGGAPLNPADATTYYFGEYQPSIPTTAQNFNKFQFNENLTITRAVISIKQVGNGSNESVSFYLRASATTDNTLTTSLDQSFGAALSKVFVYSGLSISVTSGTDYEIKLLCPTWATNPTTVQYNVKLYGY